MTRECGGIRAARESTLSDAERTRIRELARATAAALPPLDSETKAALRVLLAPVRIRRAPPKPTPKPRGRPPDIA